LLKSAGPSSSTVMVLAKQGQVSIRNTQISIILRIFHSFFIDCGGIINLSDAQKAIAVPFFQPFFVDFSTNFWYNILSLSADRRQHASRHRKIKPLPLFSEDFYLICKP
jgi:hypothetical protein